jgi:LacI family transcriptional regulator
MNSTEIARLAGVSQSTVSRVLNGNPRVSAKTRDRVLAVIAEQHYVPNVLARSLVTQRSHAIGLVVSNITNQFYPELIDAVCNIAMRHDFNVILCNTRQDPARQREYLRLLIEQRVAGILVTSTMMESPYVAELVQQRYPIVLVNRHLAEVESDAVLIDNEAGARKAVNHLIGLGHTRIAYVGGLKGTTTNRDRERGYRSALTEAKLPVQSDYELPGDYTIASAKSAAHRFVELGDRPTAALCADDGMALGFIDGLYDAELAVPSDCAVIGFDDVGVASHRLIGLTTIRQPVAVMAEEAMTLLLSRMGGNGPAEPRRVVLDADLVIRRSCGQNPRWPESSRFDGAEPPLDAAVGVRTTVGGR